MQNYFRIQTKNIKFSQMQKYNSRNGAGSKRHSGLAAADSVSALRGYIKSWMVGNPDTDFEVVIFTGEKVGTLYDGILTHPVTEIARVAVSDFMENDKYYDYEN